ncbi:MAG: MFS transporter [Firmicutes bacterium]|nr:MFS transporter [Bacillota bacterium]
MKGMSGKQFWILVKCCICIGCSVGLISNCIGIFYTPMSQALGTGRGQIAVISTIISMSAGFFGQVAARLVKKYRMNIVMSLGVLLTVAGFFVLSLSEKLPVLYAMAVFIGIGDICFKNLTVAIVLRSWFGNRSASKLGIAMAFSGVTAAVMNPILSRIIQAYGYSTGFKAMALALAVLALPAAYTIRMNDEEEAPAKVQAAGETAGTAKPEAQKTVIPVVTLVLLSAVFPIAIAGTTGMNSHFSSYAVTVGYSLSFGATVVSFQSIFNSVWKLVYGMLADRIGVVRSCMIYMGLVLVSCIMLLTLTSVPAGMILAVCLFPCAFSVSTVGIPTLVQTIAKERYAEVYATVNMFHIICYSLYTSIYGTISDRAGSYFPCMILVLVNLALSAAVCLYIGRKNNVK